MKSILNFYEVIDDLPKSPPLLNPNQRIVDAARRASQTPVSQPSFFRDVVHKSLTTNPFGAKKAETSKFDMPEKFNPPVKKLQSFSAPAVVPVGSNKQFMVDKAASIRSKLSAVNTPVSNNAKLEAAKNDATRAAEDYKAAHPVSTPPASAPSSKPFSLNNNIDQAVAHRVPPGVASTPVTSVAPPIDTSNMPSRFDFKAAAEAGTAVNAAKKVGGTLLDKIKDPDIINRGAQVMSKLGDVTGYGK